MKYFVLRYNYLVYIIVVLIIAVIGFFLHQFWKYKTGDQGAPYVALDEDNVEAILRNAAVNKEDIVYDLGSGDGRIPITAALIFGSRAVGIEIDKIRYFISLYKCFLLRLSDKVTFLNKNIFDVDLSQATVVFMFLLPETNVALIEKLHKELKNGTIIISAAFDFPGWIPVFVDHEHSTPFGPIYYYEIGKSNLNLETNVPTK